MPADSLPDKTVISKSPYIEIPLSCDMYLKIFVFLSITLVLAGFSYLILFADY